MAKHLALNQLRSKVYFNNLSESKDQLSYEENRVEIEEFRIAVYDCIDRLPDRSREVLLLHRIKGLKQKEISEKQKAADTQMDMNITAAEMYQMWDDTLNIVWGLLEANLNEVDMEVLRKEEKEWIAFKDAEVQAAGQECEGGSIQPSVEASRAADLTKARVYELAEYAK